MRCFDAVDEETLLEIILCTRRNQVWRLTMYINVLTRGKHWELKDVEHEKLFHGCSEVCATVASH